ncbi:hypothetical protein [Chitinophaga caseinilytica]|uniref:hypothetical protein n=1 Tax=Chitinophaga caseinilytica TaxID=2267521 RepID=UPI003C2DDAC5
MKIGIPRLTACFIFMTFAAQAQVRVPSAAEGIRITSAGRQYTFQPAFRVIFSERDPAMALKPAGIKNVEYNVLTWKVEDSSRADFQQKKIGAAMAGDGFDDRILRTRSEWRTANIFNVGESTVLQANAIRQVKDTVFLGFPSNELTAFVLTSAKPYPVLHFTFRPKRDGHYSIGFVGAPAVPVPDAKEIWQPLIWQELRAPEAAFLTPAFMATLPTTMVYNGQHTLGVLASPEHLPFQPLPTLPNSQFGIALRNEQGKMQPQVYAPIPGGYGSKMKAGTLFRFSMQLVAEPQDITHTYQFIAERIFGFRDYRKNDIASLNTVLDNMTAYAMSHYAWFVDSLKGFAYSTDVPGAVKNVSSLHPLELSIVRDDSVMFEKRAYPLTEFMLSREKFLFSLDSLQKIQSPSRRLKGPVAPLSELVALYNVFGRSNPFYLQMMEREYAGARVRNLDVKEDGASWINAMHLFKATGNREYLSTAISKANAYLRDRVYQPQIAFNDPFAGSFFFWPAYTNRWIELLQLYELTSDKKYLDAAVEGARHYAMFTWMAPAVPDSMVTVNPGGKAPMYWYLRSKGHAQVYYPEEKAPAWRLSETGLTPESSGTSTGHRGIFMTNFAPWMLKVGYYAKDTFLMNVAKASTIGRYRNFPGYHINTERTTAYEKEDFPLREHKAQSVNSFHYNHILPMAAMLIDYLVTDVFVRSKGKVHFPAEYVEGYAYLQNNMYGGAPGTFYGEKDVQLWMPAKLLTAASPELNYIAGRKGERVFLAFTNQSKTTVRTRITLNPALVRTTSGSRVISLNGAAAGALRQGAFDCTVAPGGLAVFVVEWVKPVVRFQEKILSGSNKKGNDFGEIKAGNAKAMLFRLGAYGSRLFLYLEDDDTRWRSVQLHYTDAGGKEQRLRDTAYPFEFTVPLPQEYKLSCWLTLEGKDGSIETSEKITIGN